jgi:hypothetical protein
MLNRRLLGLIALTSALIGSLAFVSEVQSQDGNLHEASSDELVEQGFTPLFNGKNLEGWTNPYEYGEASVVEGEIHLKGTRKFFLVTEKKYADFILVVEIKLPPGTANSGVMFRAHAKPNSVFGYQAECDGSDRRWSGGLYDEGRREWIWPSMTGRSKPEFLVHEKESQEHFKKPEIRDALRREDWNRYVIECRGDHIQISINGTLITDLHDSMDAEGIIGLQHHGEKDQIYKFRNVFIKELTVQRPEASVELLK